jgi:hypothetical protein
MAARTALRLRTQNTRSYSIDSVAEGDAGMYDVLVSNVGGTATSAAARRSPSMRFRSSHSTFQTQLRLRRDFCWSISYPRIADCIGIKPAWRFVGEQEWRLPGVPVGGLATGDRQIEFRPVPGYLRIPCARR